MIPGVSAASDYSPRRVGLILFASGWALYAITLGAGFLSDDLPLVNAALSGASVFGLPHEFTVQVLRPVTYSTYRVEAMLWGPWAPGFHGTQILLHILASWLLFQFTDLVTGRRSIAFWSALVFLASSVHSEAVTTIFGRTEPVMTCAVLSTAYAWARYRLRGGVGWMLAGYVGFAVALLSKEPSLLFLGVIVVLEGWLTLRRSPTMSARAIGGAVVRLVPFFLTAGAYLAVRQSVFGDPVGNYSGFQATPLHMLANLRWFLLRTLVPGTVRNLPLVRAHLDQVMMAIGGLLLLLAARRPSERGAIAFFSAALLITMAPVLPLSIAIHTTESERLVYLPSAFAATLTVIAARQLFARQALFTAAMCVFVLVHGVALTHQNRKWIAGGTYVRTTIQTMRDLIKAHPDVDAVMLMNIADSAKGTFLMRDGFFPAIQMYASDLGGHPPIWPIAAHALIAVGNPVRVTQTGPRAFHFEVSDGYLVRPIDPTWFYQVPHQSSQEFDVEFTDITHRWLVLYSSAGVTHQAAVIDGPGLPFGGIDSALDVSCNGPTQVLGWALDSDGVQNVVIESAPGDATDGVWTKRADALWRTDKSHFGFPAMLRAYPGGDRIGWFAQVPCAAPTDPGQTVTLRAVAIDRTGTRGTIGHIKMTRRAP